MNNDNEELQPPITDQDSLNFGATAIGSNKTIQVLISNPGKKRMLWHADNDAKNWLSSEPSAGFLEPGEQKFVDLTARSSTLAIGRYTAMLTFTSEGDNKSSPVHIPVTMDIPHVLPPAVGLSFDLFLLSSKTTPLAFINQDSQTAQWTATIDTKGKNWLTLDRYAGTIRPHEVQTIYVTAHSGLDLKLYKAMLTFTSEVKGKKSAEVKLPVELQVSLDNKGDNGPHIVVLDQNWLDFGTQNQDTQSKGKNTILSVEAVNPKVNGVVIWTINTGGVSWLKIVEGNGILKSTLPGKILPDGKLKVFVTTDISGLPPGNYRTDLMLTFAFDLDADPTKAGREPASALIPVTLKVQ
jgi:hypothetical protein